VQPRKRWIDEVNKGLQQMDIQNWRSTSNDQEELRRIVLEAEGHYGLYRLRVVVVLEIRRSRAPP